MTLFGIIGVGFRIFVRVAAARNPKFLGEVRFPVPERQLSSNMGMLTSH
jgi:hypothetical protein